MKYNIEDYLPFTITNSKFFNNSNITTNKFYISKPNSWKSFSDLHWIYFLNPKIKMPDQGWKIHVSAGYKDTKQVFICVARYLFKQGISFKATVSMSEWIIKNSKAADRVSSGKFMTIYPTTEAQFKFIIMDLAKLLQNFELGPYILSDKRYLATNLYYRYGAFKELRNKAGILCIKDKMGNLIPDLRQPIYHQPDFVNDPFEDSIEVATIKENTNANKLTKYHIDSALQFSNAGGVYLGKSNGKRYVLKEGRPNAGIDANLRDGFMRIKHEANILNNLKQSPYVINYKESFTVWIHNYLVEEYLPWESLGDYITNNFEFNSANEKYIKAIKKIANNLIKAIEDIHERGIAIGDLQPDNILIKDTQKLVLIDFEQANEVKHKYNPGLKTNGFVDLKVGTYGQADWVAVYKIIRYALAPIINIDELSNGTSEEYRNYILLKYDKQIYDYLILLKQECFNKGNLNYIKSSKPIAPIKSDNLKDSVLKIKTGITANLNFENPRLIKGDIAQFLTATGMFNVINGALGLGLIVNDFDLHVHNKFSDWCIKNKNRLLQSADMDSGLFTGAAGIGSILYMQVDKVLGKQIIDNINWKTTKNLSLKCGLAGIGLAKLALNQVDPDEDRLFEIKKIVSYVNDNYDHCKISGLLDGKLGLLLFLEKAGKYLHDNQIIETVNQKIDIFLQNDLKKTSKGLYLLDSIKASYVPYLNSGTAGLEIVILEFLKDGLVVKNGKEVIEAISKTNNVNLTYMNGLFDGFGGLLLADLAANNFGYHNSLKKKIDLLNNYLVIKHDQILVPGSYGLKDSMDLSTGAIGLLIILQGILNNDWGKWLPIIRSKEFPLLRGSE